MTPKSSSDDHLGCGLLGGTPSEGEDSMLMMRVGLLDLNDRIGTQNESIIKQQSYIQAGPNGVGNNNNSI